MDTGSEDAILADNSTSSMSILAGHLERFMSAWEGRTPPDIEHFVPAVGDLRKIVLVELIKFDLECRWSEGLDPLYIEDYVTRFP